MVNRLDEEVRRKEIEQIRFEREGGWKNGLLVDPVGSERGMLSEVV